MGGPIAHSTHYIAAVSRHALLRLAAHSPDSPFYRSLTAGDMAAVLAPVAWLISEKQIQRSCVPR